MNLKFTKVSLKVIFFLIHSSVHYLYTHVVQTLTIRNIASAPWISLSSGRLMKWYLPPVTN